MQTVTPTGQPMHRQGLRPSAGPAGGCALATNPRLIDVSPVVGSVTP